MLGNSRRAAMGCALALGLVGVVGVAAPASADDLSCGDTITVSTALTHDLVCDGSTDGLVVDGNNIVLDLKGFTISGPGAYQTPNSGVRVTGDSRVTVTNGTVTGWQSGVVLNEAWDGAVSKIAAKANDQGINLAGGGRHLVSQNQSMGNGRDAIRLGLSTGNTVTQNVVSGNTFGIMVADFSSNNVVSRNVVTGTQTVGMAAFNAAIGTTFSQNMVSGSGQDGINTASDTSGSVIAQNQSTSNGGDGIEAWSATITKNTATFNGQLGIRAFASIDGGGNRAAFNGDPAQCVGVSCSAP